MENWYLAEDKRRRVRQVVFSLPPGQAKEPEFADLVLADKYQNLNSKSWTAGYFRTDLKMGPYLLVRADDHVADLRDCPIRVALTFYREPSAALFGLFVSADTQHIARASPNRLGVFECIYGLDVEDTVQRIRDALALSVIHMCFANKSTSMVSKQLTPSGQFAEQSPPCCRFDRIILVPAACVAVLAHEFDALLRHHGATRKDYQRGVRELSEDFPPQEHPILANHSNHIPDRASAGRKPWWTFWR